MVIVRRPIPVHIIPMSVILKVIVRIMPRCVIILICPLILSIPGSCIGMTASHIPAAALRIISSCILMTALGMVSSHVLMTALKMVPSHVLITALKMVITHIIIAVLKTVSAHILMTAPGMVLRSRITRRFASWRGLITFVHSSAS